MNLEDILTKYDTKKIYPFHMPGHKRNDQILNMINPYKIDVTEAGDLDNLYEAKGILLKAMERASEIYESDRTFFLVNGSSGGILAGISAIVNKGGKILMSRASHKSVYNAVYLRELRPIYLYPKTDESFGITASIDPLDVEKALNENSDIELVMITSPTYEGVVSDIKKIAEVAHRRNIPLMVDAAHGAHFGFGNFPERAIKLGADVVVESVHKTLPSLTQTSVMHLKRGRVDEKKLEQMLAVFQTTSPSYVLMSAIDKCMEILEREKSEKGRYFFKYEKRLAEFTEKMKELKFIRVLCMGNDSLENHPFIYAFDSGKIVISLKNCSVTGKELEYLLFKRNKIQLEMSLGDYAIAMSSIFDTMEGFERLAKAVIEIDNILNEKRETKSLSGTESIERIHDNQTELSTNSLIYPGKIETACSISAASDAEGKWSKLNESIGHISKEYVYAYPPGIPIIAPGEIISQNMVEYINILNRSGTELHSTYKEIPDKIMLMKGIE